MEIRWRYIDGRQTKTKRVEAIFRFSITNFEMNMRTLRCSRIAAIPNELSFFHWKPIGRDSQIDLPCFLLVLLILEVLLSRWYKSIHMRIERGSPIGMIQIDGPAKATRFDLHSRNKSVSWCVNR